MGLFPKLRREFDDTAIEGSEEAVFLGGVGVGFPAGEGAEGGKDELVSAQIENG